MHRRRVFPVAIALLWAWWAAPEVGERIAAAVPNGRYTLMQGCGHWPQWEDPDTFNKLHIDFLLGTAGEPAVSRD
ncbi:MAG: hypothetical protein AAFX58_11880 [Pseudomonadota bacterium]